MLCSSRYRITPLAASSPKALPPERRMACAFSTAFVGDSRSVSRVPGAEPRTSTPAVAPASHKITVHPVGRSLSVWCPTLNPGTSVMEPPWGIASSAASSPYATEGRAAPKGKPTRLRVNSRRSMEYLFQKITENLCRQQKQHSVQRGEDKRCGTQSSQLLPFLSQQPLERVAPDLVRPSPASSLR